MLPALEKPRSVLKLILRYLAEIVIIFLGITISFLFDQWREERQKKKDLIELSQSLLTDVESLKAKLRNDIGGSAEWIGQMDTLRVQRTSDEVSEPQLTWFYKVITGQSIFLFEPHSPTYLSAVNSSLYSELPDTIRHQLYTLYQVRLPFFQLLYNQQQENITHFRNNVVVPANTYLYHAHSPLQPDMKKFEAEIQRPVYGNFINQIILMEQQVYKINEEASEVLVRLEESLNKYLTVLRN